MDKELKKYFSFKDKTLSDKTKKEQLQGKNPFNPNDYIDLFIKYDIPIIYSEWYYLLRRIIERSNNWKKDIHFIFGRYLAKMKLLGYRNFTYQDTKELNQKWLEYNNIIDNFPY